ncbi:MAG: hypothetical protein ACUVRS_02495 [Armatimonadota bacterium]
MLQDLLRSRITRSICYVVILTLVSTFAPMPMKTPVLAQLMPTYSVGVVDFVNESGVQGELLARLATDAVVVEMAKTNRYDVSITRAMIKAEMERLGIRPPLSALEIVRLGEALNADAMLEGYVKSVQLSGSGPTRRAAVTLAVQMRDQASGEIINGAVQTGISSSRVGYEADDDSLIVEAVNNAAFLCVKTMVDYIIPEATVMMNIKEDHVMLNRGSRDGIKPGMRMIVLRRGEIIGYVEVRRVSPIDSDARIIKATRGIQPEDKVRAIFDMPAIVAKASTEPLPSGAPTGIKKRSDTLRKIGKFILSAGIIFGIAQIFRPGRGSEPPPTIGAGESPTIITWDPKKYGHGQNVLEYQILRDDFADTAVPVKVISDPTAVDLGWTDVYSLYGTSTATNVTYKLLASNPATSYKEVTATIPPEPYGRTHKYQVRVLYSLTTTTPGGGDQTQTGQQQQTTTTRYYYTPVSNVITATAIEPVKYTDIVSPAYDPSVAPPEILVTDLQSGAINFEWKRKDGADMYQILVEPVQPGTGPTWQSPIIYETGPVVSLPTSARIELASMLSNSAYADKTMKWRVYCRHQEDTSLAWVKGQEARFVIGGMPPTYP